MSVRWRLAAAFFLTVLGLISLVGLYLLRWTETHYMRSISEDLMRESRAAARLVQAVPPQHIPQAVRELGSDLGRRITVIRRDGTVIADSQYDYRRMEDHSDRPEVMQALATGYGTATRYSRTLKIDMLYVATRLRSDGAVAGVVRIAEPLSGLKQMLSTIQKTFLFAALAAILLAALLSLKLASSVTHPIERIVHAAQKLACGDLNARVPALDNPSDEIGMLALTFNSMAEQLQTMIANINRQTVRMQMVFDHTDDGLILINPDGRIDMVNPAACRMLGIDRAAISGKTVIEGTLNHDLASLVNRVMRTGEPGALDITLPVDEGSAHAYVTPTSGEDGIGALAVLHDMTAARQLDAVRRDFVANVSHEFRTPLSSIKAMAETILLRSKDMSVARKFAESIVNEADRMKDLADDLLSLATIESGRRRLRSESVNLTKVVEDVFDRLRPTAEKRLIELTSNVTEGSSVLADYDSVAQIFLNLVDNAIKYNREGGRVEISAEAKAEHVAIRISDTGIGIPEEDLPRVFERFYRVDKARSRESGGTGLGLSIVKHLTELLGGGVSITSEVGTGTTVTVTLPAG